MKFNYPYNFVRIVFNGNCRVIAAYWEDQKDAADSFAKTIGGTVALVPLASRLGAILEGAQKEVS